VISRWELQLCQGVCEEGYFDGSSGDYCFIFDWPDLGIEILTSEGYFIKKRDAFTPFFFESLGCGVSEG